MSGGDSRASGGGIQAPGPGWGMDESPAVFFPDSDFPRSCGAVRLLVLSANPDLLVRATLRSRWRGGILLQPADVHRRRMAPNRIRTEGYSVLYRWGVGHIVYACHLTAFIASSVLSVRPASNWRTGRNERSRRRREVNLSPAVSYEEDRNRRQEAGSYHRKARRITPRKHQAAY